MLCYDIFRFSRGGTNETGYWLHRLQIAGVDALFCAEGIPEGDEGELLQGVKSWRARQFSAKLYRDTIRGTISHITEKRCAPGGMPPFGYDEQHRSASGQVLRTFRRMPDGSKHELGPDGSLLRTLAPGEIVKKARSDLVLYVPSTPERVAVVRRIFKSCADGLGFLAIAARLNDEGVASADGGHWTTRELAAIDLAVPALSELSPEQYRAFRDRVTAVMLADRRVDLFEWVMRTVLERHVEARFARRAKPAARERLENRTDSVRLVLATLAWAGHLESATARSAFDAAIATLGWTASPLPQKDRCTLDGASGTLFGQRRAWSTRAISRAFCEVKR